MTSNQSLSSFLIYFVILFKYICFFLISNITHWSSDTTTSSVFCSLILQYTIFQNLDHFYPSLIFLYFLKYILTQSSSILHSFLPLLCWDPLPHVLIHIFSLSSLNSVCIFFPNINLFFMIFFNIEKSYFTI